MLRGSAVLGQVARDRPAQHKRGEELPDAGGRICTPEERAARVAWTMIRCFDSPYELAVRRAAACFDADVDGVEGRLVAEGLAVPTLQRRRRR